MYLGISTSHDPYNIGLWHAENKTENISLETSYETSENLNLEISAFLEQRNCSEKDLIGIGVMEGPGGYTGLRIGVSVAKTIGRVLGIPVYGFETLASIVFQARQGDGVYLSVVPARKREVNAALFSRHQGKITSLTETVSQSEEKCLHFLSCIQETINVVGVFSDNMYLELEKQRQHRVEKITVKGSTVAQLAQEEMQKKTKEKEVFPQYSHTPV